MCVSLCNNIKTMDKMLLLTNSCTISTILENCGPFVVMPEAVVTALVTAVSKMRNKTMMDKQTMRQ